jgi:hypothetical protein
MATIAVLSVLLLSIGFGCGRRGPLRPQTDMNPTAITDLKAARSASGVMLSWSRPTTYLDGSRMLDLAGFEIQRRKVDGDARFEKIGSAVVEDRERFQQARHFQYLDREIADAQTYAYRVVSYTLDGYFSAPSNIAAVDTKRTSGEANAPLPTPQQ